MRHGLLLIKKDLERIWKQHCAMLLVYLVLLTLSGFRTTPQELLFKFHYWTVFFSLLLAGGWSIYFILDERRKKTILLLLSLPISLRELIFSKFFLQLVTATSTYLIIYFTGGVSVYYFHKVNVFFPFPILAYVLAGIIVLMSFLVACTFLFNPGIAYVVVMLAGVGTVTAISLLYQGGSGQMHVEHLQRLGDLLRRPLPAGFCLLAAGLAAVGAAQLTWRILARRDPVELAV